MGELKTEASGIGSFLSKRRLAVPDYQRSYSWLHDDEVKELWDDIARAIQEGQPEYFLGTVVTIRAGEGERLQVIDGQQRLATVSLLYAALRDIYEGRSDERGKEIEQEVLGKKDRRTRALTQFLNLNAEDNDFFRQLTLLKLADRRLLPTTASHQRLSKAYDFLHAQLLKLTEGRGPDDWPEALIQWDDFMMEQALIIEVSVPNESRGFVIFETLNDRGLNLTTSDLLKNHLLGKAGERLEEAKIRWSRASGPFVAPDTRLDMETFLRHFWASRQGIVRVKDLFWQMKAAVTTAQEAIDLSDELAEASRLWTAMFDRDAELWRGYRPSAVAALDTLRNLNVEQCRPLLLAALRRFSPREVEKVLALVVNWSVRWIVVGGAGAGTPERLYAATAKKITDRELVHAAGVAEEFATAVPGDLAFQQSFETAVVNRGWLSRYYLQVLERVVRGDPEPELVPNENVEEVNLEHVLPRNPTEEDWPTFTNEERQLMTNMLGNQCLMPRTPNDQLGNKPFSTKQPQLSSSAFELTKEIGAQPGWDPSAIRTRQQRLAVAAVAAWPKA